VLDAAARYRPGPSTADALLLVSDTVLSSEAVSVHSSGSGAAYAEAWCSRYPAGLPTRATPGGHLDMMTDPQVVAEIAALIRDDLASHGGTPQDLSSHPLASENHESEVAASDDLGSGKAR
jgi:hypothetical protein